jgi:hypothetical protein
MSTIFNHPHFGPVALGKRPVRHDRLNRTLKFRDYNIRSMMRSLAAKTPLVDASRGKLGTPSYHSQPDRMKISARTALPPVPAEVSWFTKVPASAWRMYYNDTLGTCGPAMVGHSIVQASFYAGKEIIPTDAQIMQVYKDVGGYVPGDPSTDNGVDLLTLMNYMRQVGVAGNKWDAFMSVNWKDLDEVREAIQIFGRVLVGTALPATAQGQANWTVALGGTATANGAPGSWGGHATPYFAMSPESINVNTWATNIKESHNFELDYVDEMYVAVDPLWIGANGVSPSDFNMAQLMADLKTIT